jgi:hypothetical protein
MASVARSPRVAAIGVAMLSGFIPYLFDSKIMPVKRAPLSVENKFAINHEM